jgi:hypothetical protein
MEKWLVESVWRLFVSEREEKQYEGPDASANRASSLPDAPRLSWSALEVSTKLEHMTSKVLQTLQRCDT